MTLLETLGIDLTVAYDAGRALNAAAKTAHEAGYGAQWVGQGPRLARERLAAPLVALLAEEIKQYG